ncbi:MAG: HAD family phosphatase [Candidatus Micrarchaeota archaeon]|nr:HAD family phosphatase [Candidatus Micrarchaeota archaeon]
MRTIVLLDIDGTLVDPDYKINSNSIFDVIKKCEAQGALFALNSNRAIEDLLPIYKQFFLNGFIIGENGAFFTFPGQKMEQYSDAKQIVSLAAELSKLLESSFPGSKFLTRDTVSFLKSPNIKNSGELFVANKFRKYTMSIFVGKVVDGKFVKDIPLARLVASAVSAKIADLGLKLEIVVSPVFGNVLINPIGCSKASTFEKIVERDYKGCPTVMISDDESDSMIGSVGTFYTLSNAPESIKNKASYVSDYEYTKGVEDILQKKVLKG